MSKRALEDKQEREQAAEIAASLGISLDDLDLVEWHVEPHESNDGVIYGYNVYFEPGSDPSVLKKIDGLIDGRWVRIGP